MLWACVMGMAMPHCAGCGRPTALMCARLASATNGHESSSLTAPYTASPATQQSSFHYVKPQTGGCTIARRSWRTVRSPLPLYVVFGADVFRNASVGIMRRPACVMTAGSALVATCCTTVRRQAASAPRLHICPSLHRHPQRFAHACLPRVMVGWDTGTARLRTRVTPAGQR